MNLAGRRVLASWSGGKDSCLALWRAVQAGASPQALLTMADESGEKTEEPTSKRLDDARRKGQVWKSRDLTGVASFTVAMAVLKGTWDLVQSRLKLLFDYGFDRVAHPVDLSHAVFESLFLGFVALMLASIPVALGAAVAATLQAHWPPPRPTKTPPQHRAR